MVLWRLWLVAVWPQSLPCRPDRHSHGCVRRAIPASARASASLLPTPRRGSRSQTMGCRATPRVDTPSGSPASRTCSARKPDSWHTAVCDRAVTTGGVQLSEIGPDREEVVAIQISKPTALRVIAAASLALLAACCGGSGKSPANGATLSQNPMQAAFRYSACMRNHGVTNFPDPQVVNHNGEHGIRIQDVGPKALPSSPPPQRRARESCPRRAATERRKRPTEAHPARGRTVVRQVRAQPWCDQLPGSDRAGRPIDRDGPGPGNQRALAGSSKGRAGVPAGVARRAHPREGQGGAQQRQRLSLRRARRQRVASTRAAVASPERIAPSM